MHRFLIIFIIFKISGSSEKEREEEPEIDLEKDAALHCGGRVQPE